MKYILASSLIVWTSCAVAVPCTSTYETCDALPIMLTGCELGQTYSPGCIGGTTTRYVSCNSCKTGYIRVLTSGVASSGCTYDYYKCQPDEEEECNENTNCISDTSWSAASVGYEKKVTRRCATSLATGKKECKETSTSYRCAANYYGNPETDSSGCVSCGTYGGAKVLSKAGSTKKTDCYIPANTEVTDSTGTFVFTTNCYYTE